MIMRIPALVLAAALAAGGMGAWWASEEGWGPRIGPQSCVVLGEAGEHHRLSPDRAAVAGVIAAVAQERGLGPQAAAIGIATGIQESGLRNLDHGDEAGPDSRGVFQQRPSQGWGTQAEVMDPVRASHGFFAELENLVPDYADLPVTEAAQAVQRSAYPDAYADHEEEARAWAAALTGREPQRLRCRLAPAEGADPNGFTAASARQHPSVVWRSTPDGAALVADASGEEAASLAAWAVVNAAGHGVRRVEAGDLVWDRAGDGGLSPRAEADPAAAPVEGVRVTF